MSYRGWHIADVLYLHHKAVTSIALEREDGKRLYVNVSDAAFKKHPTVYFSSDQAKESPQGIDSDDESIVGAGTDFLMKVTEEAVITGMILCEDGGHKKARDERTRSIYRPTAESVVLEELKRFTSTDPHQSDAPEPVKVGPVPVPEPVTWTEPSDRHSPGAVNPLSPSEEFQKWAEKEHEEYLDKTKGPSS